MFDHLLPYLADNGALFGSTLLGEGVPSGLLARGLAAFYNRHRIFSNRHDRLGDLRRVLEERFAEVRVETVGCAALFAARALR